jgi:hypothetical protein
LLSIFDEQRSLLLHYFLLLLAPVLQTPYSAVPTIVLHHLAQDGVIEHKRIFLEEKYVRVEVTLAPFELVGRMSTFSLSLA